MNFKPMLSASLDGVDLSTLRYPLLASPKLDGVRCIIWEGVAYSRNAKPIRNRFVQEWAKNHHNLDGELIVGAPIGGNVLGRTQSGVMSADGEPDFTYWMFDNIYREDPHFWENYGCQWPVDGRITIVEQKWVRNSHALSLQEDIWLAEGYEGIMLRDPNGPYKHGRSTVREGYLMKLKRFIDGEAVVIGLEEAMENQNVATTDELGRTKRSSHQENLVGKGMIGTIIVKDPKFGEMRLSTGVMTHAERVQHWRDDFIGKTVHWRAFGYGMKDMPRFPRYYGIREDV